LADREAVALLAETTRLIQQALDERSTAIDDVTGASALIEKLNLLVDVMHEEQGNAARDRGIINVFLAEGMDLIMDADNLLARWAHDPEHTAELENLRNELRQVASGARNAGIQEIDELASLLGDCYSAVADHSLTRTDELLTLAGQAHEALITMMDYLAAGQALVRDEGLLADLRNLLPQGPGGPDGGMDVEELSFEDVAVPSGEVEEIDFATPVAEPPAPSAQLPTDDDQPLEVLGDIDTELLEIFLEEAEEVLETASNALDTWENGDASLVPALQRDLHTLKGAARMAGIAAIGDLGHELENLYEGFNNGHFEADPSLFRLLHQCHDRLIEMVEMVRDQGACRRAPALVAAINGFLAGHGIAVPEDDTATPAADVTAVEAPAPVAAQPEEVEPPVHEEITPQQPVPVEDATPLPPPERDEELVGIFLEEADEILESAGTSLESWMEAPDNLIEVQSLQRDLHTLKGGARMAEIPELGDLGHELENLYEGLALGNLK